MILEKVHILPTESTPEFILQPEGIIKIKGRSLFVNKTSMPPKVFTWIKHYVANPAETTTVIIALEYLNSFGTRILISVLQEIMKVTIQNKKLTVSWFYENEDDDILERGEYISSSFNIPVKFIITGNISGC